MSKTTTGQRVAKAEFMQRVSRRSGMTEEDVTTAWEAIAEELSELAAKDITVILQGFGKFYPVTRTSQTVKARVEAGAAQVVMGPTRSLRFSATRPFNHALTEKAGLKPQKVSA